MIRLNEPNEAAAEVPFTLPLATDPLTGLTGHAFTLGEVEIRLVTGEWVDVATNKIREVGYGRFAARLAEAQRAAAGIIAINVEVTSTQPYRGTEVIGTGSGDFNEGQSGYLVFYLADAVDPVYGEPLSGAFSSLPGALARVAWPDQAYVDVDPATVIELERGMYGIPMSAEQAVRGKAYYFATADDAQRFESYVTILTATTINVPDEEDPAEPVPSPVLAASTEYADHVQRAVNRLCEYSKYKAVLPQ